MYIVLHSMQTRSVSAYVCVCVCRILKYSTLLETKVVFVSIQFVLTKDFQFIVEYGNCIT